MKHQSTLILTAVVVLMASCSRDFEAVDTPAPVAEETADEGYVVSVEQALTSLDNELAMIYGDDETRAAQPRRRVKAIHNVAYDRVAPVTRSADAPDDMADLFYIVEFADGQGSAVLGADKRVEPVVAILDETVLTPEDFASADIESDDITSYMAALMINSVNDGITTFDYTLDPGTRLPVELNPVRERDTVDVYTQAALLNTKWHQGSPYNDMCEVKTNKYGVSAHIPAGCGPIAIAQILKSNRYPQTITINGDSFNWTLLDGCNYGVTPSYYAKIEVARFVYKIGVYTNLAYNEQTSQSSISPSAIPPLLRHVGYQSVSLIPLAVVDARNMICNDQHAFFITGYTSDDSGHGWVIDGWNEYTVRLWEVTYDYRVIGDPVEISRELKSSTVSRKVHCNFGWGGDCDGYYTYNVFNTNYGNYSIDNNMITYSLPQ